MATIVAEIGAGANAEHDRPAAMNRRAVVAGLNADRAATIAAGGVNAGRPVPAKDADPPRGDGNSPARAPSPDPARRLRSRLTCPSFRIATDSAAPYTEFKVHAARIRWPSSPTCS